MIEVERRTTTYAFAADEHERLSGAQRQLLRMGRENATAVQAKLREIRSVFGWPAAPSPTETRHAVISGEGGEVLEPVLIAEVIDVDPGSDGTSEVANAGLLADPVMTVVPPPIRGGSSPVLPVADTAAAPTE